MKKTVLLILSILFCLCLPSFASAESRTVDVSIPTFAVTVNGVEYDSRCSEYPFFLCNDITYMPMTYDFSTFMGLKITFDTGTNAQYHPGEMILHIGNGKRTASELGQYLKEEENKTSYKAVIPDYHTYIAFEENEYDNSSPYPIISYNGVTYLPLTWDNVHTLLDWDYSFDPDKGLVINSTEAVRPIGLDKRLFNRMGTSTSEYVFGRNCYVEYDVYLYYSGRIFRVTADGEKDYHLMEPLKGKINYFNRMINENGAVVQSTIPPKLNGSVLEIVCAETDFDRATVLVTIDLESGEILSTEVLK